MSGRFGIGEGSLHRCCIKVMDYLVDISPTIIKFPATDEEKEKSASDFKAVNEQINIII